jgi:RNA polymerase sigma factor (sigma-70 family)
MSAPAPTPRPSGPGPDELFAAFKAGYQALWQLFEQHRAYLRKIIDEEMPAELRRRADVSDIIQEAHLDVVAHLTREGQGLFGVEQKEDLRRWLRRVGLNALRHQERYAQEGKRHPGREVGPAEAIDPAGGGPSPSSLCRRGERDELVGRAVNALPEADRILLRLYVWHGWTHRALAELLDGRESDAGRVRVQRRLTERLLRLREDGTLQDLGS